MTFSPDAAMQALAATPATLRAMLGSAPVEGGLRT